MSFLRSYGVAAGAIICFAVTLAFAFVQLLAIQSTLASFTGENMLWNVMQAEHETRKLKDTILQLPETQDYQELTLRHDILLSRMKILNDNPQHAFYAKWNGAQYIAELNRIFAQFSAMPLDGTVPPRTLSAILEPSFAQFAPLNNKVMIAQRVEGGAQRDRQLHIIYIIMICVAGLFAAGGFLSWQLVSKLRALDSANIALHTHQEQLEATIAERTLALREALDNERRTNEIYKNFLSTVSHQFRTPIAIIDMIAQRFTRHPSEVTRDQLIERAQRIRTAVKRLILIMDSTINNDRLNEKGISLTLADIDLVEIASTACLYHTENFPHRTVKLEKPDTCFNLKGDRTLIEQIIINFLSNAEKYSPKDQPIIVSLLETERHYICSVQDYGVGIPEEERDKIFGRFYRAKNVSHLEGSGLGLNISFMLAQLHGGDIVLQPDVQSGTVIELRMPKCGGNDD